MYTVASSVRNDHQNVDSTSVNTHQDLRELQLHHIGVEVLAIYIKFSS